MVRELRCLYKPTSNTFYSSLVLSYTYRGLKRFQALDLCFWNNIQKKVPIIDPMGTSNRDQGLKNQRKKNQKHIFCKIWSSFTNLMVCHGAPLKAHTRDLKKIAQPRLHGARTGDLCAQWKCQSQYSPNYKSVYHQNDPEMAFQSCNSYIMLF